MSIKALSERTSFTLDDIKNTLDRPAHPHERTLHRPAQYRTRVAPRAGPAAPIARINACSRKQAHGDRVSELAGTGGKRARGDERKRRHPRATGFPGPYTDRLRVGHFARRAGRRSRPRWLRAGRGQAAGGIPEASQTLTEASLMRVAGTGCRCCSARERSPVRDTQGQTMKRYGREN